MMMMIMMMMMVIITYNRVTSYTTISIGRYPSYHRDIIAIIATTSITICITNVILIPAIIIFSTTPYTSHFLFYYLILVYL